MSETQTAPAPGVENPGPATPPPADAPATAPALNALGMTDARLTFHRNEWIRMGHDPAVFDAHVQRASGTTQDAAAPTFREQVNALKENPEWLERFFGGDPEAKADFDRLTGATPAETPASGQDTRSAEKLQYDAAFGMGEDYSPDKYHIDYRAAYGGPDPMDLPTRAELDQGYRSMLSAMNMPTGLGSALIERIVQVENATASMTPAARARFLADGQDRAANIGGGNQAEIRQYAEAAVRFSLQRNPATGETWQKIMASTAWQDASVQRILAAHGRQLNAWLKGRPQ